MLLEQYLHSRAVPVALRQRIVKFFDYVHGAASSFEVPDTIGQLPLPIQLHLLIVTNRRLFTDVAL